MKSVQLMRGILVTFLTAGVTPAMPDWEQAHGKGFGDPQTGNVTVVRTMRF